MQDARSSLLKWLERCGGTLANYVFASKSIIPAPQHMAVRQALDERVVSIGSRKKEYGTHSLRRTVASSIYKATQRSFAAALRATSARPPDGGAAAEVFVDAVVVTVRR